MAVADEQEGRADRRLSAPALTRLTGWRLTLVRAVWVVITVLSVLLSMLAIPLRYAELTRPSAPVRAGLQQVSLAPDFYATYHSFLSVVFILGFVIVGLIIFLRRSDDWMAAFVSLMLIAIGTTDILDALVRARPQWAFLVNALSAIAWVSFLIFFYVFPDGRFVPRWTGALALGFAVFAVMTQPFNPELWSPLPWTVSMLAWTVTGVVAQVYRYWRVSSPIQRQQTKWIVFGLCAAFVGFFVITLPGAMYNLRDSAGQVALYYDLGWRFAFILIMLLLPSTIGFSVLRYRLWDINLIINRTLVYVPLTAILAGLYTASITLLQRFFVAVTGNTSDAAVVVTTLTLVTLATPIKDGLQKTVDRYFKEVPDPVRRLQAFVEQVRRRIFMLDTDQVICRLLDEVVAAFDSESGVVYLGPEGKQRLLHTCGEWRGQAEISLPLEQGRRYLGWIALSRRCNGLEYTPRDREGLQEVIALIMEAISRQSAMGEAQ